MVTKNGKKKLLIISDHALYKSGVATQTLFLVDYLTKTGDYEIVQLGLGLKHPNPERSQISDSFVIHPVYDKDLENVFRQYLNQWNPDCVLIFTDPRFFYWLYSMEDEVHQICPIAYWHVWDNITPYPKFNDKFYQATDLIACHSHLTYTMLKDKYPEKAHFVPHTLPKNLYKTLSAEENLENRKKYLKPHQVDHFLGTWINRNMHRKRPADLLQAWSIFLNELEEQEGHKNASLLMHTNPGDQNGNNLIAISKMLEIEPNIIFSTNKVPFQQLNEYYNMSDFTINISYAEGFGLGTLESMQVGTPIIAPKTGGQTRQVVDYRDGSENGVALDIKFQKLTGNQHVPYIHEDYCTIEDIVAAFWKMYKLTDEEKVALSTKVKNYVDYEFDYEKRSAEWDFLLKDVMQNWRKNYKAWVCEEI